VASAVGCAGYLRFGSAFGLLASAFVVCLGAPACSADGHAGAAKSVDASLPDSALPPAGQDAQATDSSSETALRDGGIDDSAPEDASDASDAGQADEADAGISGCGVGDGGEPTELRCTGLYADWTSKTVSADARQYDPGLHLWSDGAVKTRWLYLPADPSSDAGATQPINTSNMDEWSFPAGTKFWKEFALGGKRIETRLLWKQNASTWYRTTYRWSADESSATELTTGALDADGNGYEIPDQAKCNQCHDGRKDGVLGFEAVSLASAGATPMTMATLAAQRLITDVPDASLDIPGNAIDVAALGYLHANCGVACHNGGAGAARITGFLMRLDVAKLGGVQATDTWTTGVNRRTVLFSIPGDNSTVRLVPNDAGASCVYYRMTHRDAVSDAGSRIQMPPVDTHRIDDAGVALIGQWINQGCQ
jgi:hypothetical protein